nr:ferritin-like domain-containing protein [Kineosporia mesophila]
MSPNTGTSLAPPASVPVPPAGRRAFLALGTLALTSVGLTACSSAGSAVGTTAAASTDSGPEAAAVARAVTTVTALRASASALASGTLPNGATLRIKGSTAKLLTRTAEAHTAQLTDLGSPVSGTTSPTPGPTSSGTPDTSGTETAESPSALAKAEWSAARTLLGDAAGLSPAFAGLLYRLAASCAANADLLRSATGGKAFGELTVSSIEDDDEDASPSASATSDEDATTPGTSATSSSSTLTTGESGALNRLLAGEHAAFYAYPLVVAHIGGDRREVADEIWEVHRQQRDELERLLLAANVDPVQGSAAYSVTPPTSAGKAAALATTIEQRLAGLAVDVIAVAQDDTVTTTAAGVLVDCTRRQAAWTKKPVADPGSSS